MSPIETAFLMKLLVGAGILFVIGYIGNVLSFSNRFMNALVTAVVFAIIYGLLYFVIDKAVLTEKLGAISQKQWFQMVGVAAAVVFVIDFVANMLAFGSRFGNALMTAIVFVVVFGGLMYLSGGVPAPA